MNFSSKIIESAVHEFSKLPGVGKKTALRYVLHLMRQSNSDVEKFTLAFSRLKNDLKHCKMCHNISDHDICEICANPRRELSIVCVVEDIRDVMAIENTQQYKGVYHVLGGIISPMDGIGPGDLNIESLVDKAKNKNLTEVILALNTTMEGETTNFYIYKKLKEFEIPVSTIARGIAIGDELEYTDEITLGRSIVNRMPYENNLSFK